MHRTSLISAARTKVFPDVKTSVFRHLVTIIFTHPVTSVSTILLTALLPPSGTDIFRIVGTNIFLHIGTHFFRITVTNIFPNLDTLISYSNTLATQPATRWIVIPTPLHTNLQHVGLLSQHPCNATCNTFLLPSRSPNIDSETAKNHPPLSIYTATPPFFNPNTQLFFLPLHANFAQTTCTSYFQTIKKFFISARKTI